MTLRSAPYYWLTCDAEGCKTRSTDGSEYGASHSPVEATADAEDSDWLVIDGKHYCPEHVPDEDGDE